jgi:hypothetical protein
MTQKITNEMLGNSEELADKPTSSAETPVGDSLGYLEFYDTWINDNDYNSSGWNAYQCLGR